MVSHRYGEKLHNQSRWCSSLSLSWFRFFETDSLVTLLVGGCTTQSHKTPKSWNRTFKIKQTWLISRLRNMKIRAVRKSRLGWPHQGDVVHELRYFRSDMHSCTLWFMYSWLYVYSHYLGLLLLHVKRWTLMIIYVTASMCFASIECGEYTGYKCSRFVIYTSRTDTAFQHTVFQAKPFMLLVWLEHSSLPWCASCVSTWLVV